MLGHVRYVSQVVLDSPFRLEVGAGVYRLLQLGRESFTTRELQGVLDAPLDHDNNAGRQLKRLAEADLVESVSGGLWHPAESPFWSLCDTWLRDLLGE
jgi:hypothetical protein